MSPADRVDSNPGFTLDIAKILELDRINARNELSAMLDTKMGGVEKAVSGLQDDVKGLGQQFAAMDKAFGEFRTRHHDKIEGRLDKLEAKITTSPPPPAAPAASAPATKNMKIATIAAIIGSGGIGALVGSGGLVALVKAIFEGIAK